VTYFMNLGKDSGLVVPCPKAGGDQDRFKHIKNFIVNGSTDQVCQYFQRISDEAEGFINSNGGAPTYICATACLDTHTWTRVARWSAGPSHTCLLPGASCQLSCFCLGSFPTGML